MDLSSSLSVSDNNVRSSVTDTQGLDGDTGSGVTSLSAGSAAMTGVAVYENQTRVRETEGEDNPSDASPPELPAVQSNNLAKILGSGSTTAVSSFAQNESLSSAIASTAGNAAGNHGDNSQQRKQARSTNVAKR